MHSRPLYGVHHALKSGVSCVGFGGNCLHKQPVIVFDASASCVIHAVWLIIYAVILKKQLYAAFEGACDLTLLN